MISYIVYLLLLPLVIILVLLLSLINQKIRKNLINGLNTRKRAKEYLDKHSSDKEIIIMHAASAGEFEQLKPILREIDRSKYFIIQTFLSPTIYENEYNNNLFDVSCYHPLDFPAAAFVFFETFKPKIYLTTRHDIWPHHLVIAKWLDIKCYLINANLYQKSKRFNPIAKSLNEFIFNKFDKILTGSEKLKENLSQMVPVEKITVTGDSRFDQIKYRANNPPHLEQLDNDSKYIILGSIDREDLPIIKDAMCNFKSDVKYIIAPHEVDSNIITEIDSLLNDINISYIHLSKSKNQKIEDYQCLIIDSIGILFDLYKYADIAYVGSGFSTGVHSVIEPLAQNCVVCYGPKIDILDEAIDITNLQIGQLINNSKELLNVFKLIEDTEILIKIKSNGMDYIDNQINATKKIIKILEII